MTTWLNDARIRIVLACLASATTAGCGGDDAGYDHQTPYGAYTMTTTWQYGALGLDGTVGTYTLAFNGRETVGGTTYEKLTLERPGKNWNILVTPAPIGLDDGPLTIGGLSGSSGFTLNPTEPIVLDPDSQVGVPVPMDWAFTGYDPIGLTDYSGTVTGTYTLLDTNATAQTPLGSVPGCRHYTGTGSVAGTGIPAILIGVEVTVDLWYHEVYGLVKYDVPDLGLSGDMTGTWDEGSPANGFATIRKIGVIDGAVTEFRLDSYDLHGEFDADKNTHAKMLLELRWLDEERARTGPMPSWPAVEVEFGTVWGVFPATLTESPVSIFHPEENGNGFKYWFAFVDEAARNEPGENGIAYHVSVTADTDITPALRATARIYYKLYP